MNDVEDLDHWEVVDANTLRDESEDPAADFERSLEALSSSLQTAMDDKTLSGLKTNTAAPQQGHDRKSSLIRGNLVARAVQAIEEAISQEVGGQDECHGRSAIDNSAQRQLFRTRPRECACKLLCTERKCGKSGAMHSAL